MRADELRQCSARHAQRMYLRCQDEATEMTVHKGFHWAVDRDGQTVRWDDLVSMYPAIDGNFLPRPELANPGRVQIVDCKATYPEPNGASLRCDGRHNEEGLHGQDSPGGAGRINWTESVAMYPTVDGNFHDVKAPASERQVGGEHYKKYKIQPWDIVDEYGLDFYAGNALKYLLRDKTDRLEDLKKARHYLDKLIEKMEGHDGG